MVEIYLRDTGLFLVDTALGLYVFVVLLRLLFQFTRADFYNPITQFIVKAGNLPIRRLRRILPTVWGIDFTLITFLFVLEASRIAITTVLTGRSPQVAGVLILSAAELLKLTVYIFVFSLFVRALLSWITTNNFHPLLKLLYSFTEPMLVRARRILPITHGVDLSPIVAFLVLMLLLKILVNPLHDIGNIFLY